MLNKYAQALAPFWPKTMPGIGDNSLSELMTFAQLGLRLRLLGKEDMQEFMRIATLPMRDLVEENFRVLVMWASALLASCFWPNR